MGADKQLDDADLSLLAISERVIAALRGVASDSDVTARADRERAWTLASQGANGDYAGAQAGMDLALRRADKVVACPEKEGDDRDWGISFDEFIAQSVRDAARIGAAEVEVLRHLGWAPGDANAGTTKAVYREAAATAAQIASRLAGNVSAGDILHHAMLNVVTHFARAIDPPDITNPKGYAYQVIHRAGLNQFRAAHGERSGRDIVDLPDAGPGPEMTAMAEPFFPHLRFAISCRLFGGVLAPLTAALLLGMVSAFGEGALLESWPWPDPPMPKPTAPGTDRLKYWVLRKVVPDRFVPDGPAFSPAQRQEARKQMSVARSHLGQLLRDTDRAAAE